MQLDNARIAVLAENQYQELELWYPVMRFREAGAAVTIVGPRSKVKPPWRSTPARPPGPPSFSTTVTR